MARGKLRPFRGGLSGLLPSLYTESVLRAQHFSASRFNGVSWHISAQKFQANLSAKGSAHHLGLYSVERDAALAYDAKLRELFAGDGRRLKKSLNFPSLEESSFKEAPVQARARNMTMSAARSAEKEVTAVNRLLMQFQKTVQASTYEIAPVSSASRVDAIFRRLGTENGTQLQLKSASGSGTHLTSYRFSNVGGYSGMLLILIALDRDLMWAMQGTRVAQNHLRMSIGGQRDQAYRIHDLGLKLETCFHNIQDYPHMAMEDARLQCSPRCRVEELAHRQCKALLQQTGFNLQQQVFPSTADSLLSGLGFQYLVQEKAAHASKRNGSYITALSKRGGPLGKQPYTLTDFDMLMVSLLDGDNHLEGLLLIPIHVLQAHGLVDVGPVTMHVYPPWALPKREATKLKHAWQLEYFVDLRGGAGGLLGHDTQKRLVRMLANATLTLSRWHGAPNFSLRRELKRPSFERCHLYASHCLQHDFARCGVPFSTGQACTC